MTTSVSPSATAMETNARPWWLLFLQGCAAVIIGAVLLWALAKAKVETWQLLVALLGLYQVIGGILDLVHMFTDHSAWVQKLFMGLISILVGNYILMYLIATAVVLPKTFVLVLGVWGLIQGIVALMLAFKGGGWGLGIMGVVGIFFGLLLIGNYTVPGMGLTLLWVAAIWAVVGGISMIVQAFRQRSA